MAEIISGLSGLSAFVIGITTEMAEAIAGNPLLLLGVAGIPLVGLGVGILSRLFSQRV